MNVRAKFKLVEIRSHHGIPIGRTFVFRPEYDYTIPEDRRFYNLTPSGCCEMFVTNPKVLKEFKLGENYYLDFSPCSENTEDNQS